jgi:hypothetical protein
MYYKLRNNHKNKSHQVDPLNPNIWKYLFNKTTNITFSTYFLNPSNKGLNHDDR